MSRAEVKARKSQAAFSQFSSLTGRTCYITGWPLLRDQKVLLKGHETAAEVRKLLGEPREVREGHVVATVGGFFWFYPGNLAVGFIDDDFSAGDRAKIFEICLLDSELYE